MTPSELANRIRTYGWWQGPEEPLVELVERLEVAEGALRKLAEKQQQTLGTLRKNGIVFDNIDEHWQKVAFTIYSDLCEVDTIARQALGEGAL